MQHKTLAISTVLEQMKMQYGTGHYKDLPLPRLIFCYVSTIPFNVIDCVKRYLSRCFLIEHSEYDDSNNMGVMTQSLFFGYEDDAQGNNKSVSVVCGNVSYSQERVLYVKNVIESQKRGFCFFVDYPCSLEIKKLKGDFIICNVGDKLTESDKEILAHLFPFPLSLDYVKELFSYQSVFSLEALCYFMKYAPLVPRARWRQKIQYLDEYTYASGSLLYSLFDLMTYFFQKNKKQFFKIFFHLRETSYNEEFLFYYFMEQIWSAYLFCSVANKENVSSETKKKLCWWFLQNGYKKYNPEDFLLLYNDMFNQYITAKYYGREKHLIDGAFLNWFCS